MVIALALLGGLIANVAQTSAVVEKTSYQIEYEDAELRVLRLVLAPHQVTESRQHPDRVVVFLTSDWQGRRPDNPVEWQSAGRRAEKNPGNGTFEAILVELKGSETSGPLPGPRTYAGVAQVQVVNNARVEVRRIVVAPGAIAPSPGCHVHGKPTVYVHLTAGEVAGVTGGSKAVAVARGQVTVLAPGQQHFFFGSTAGLADFVEIHPQGDRSQPQSDCR